MYYNIINLNLSYGVIMNLSKIIFLSIAGIFLAGACSPKPKPVVLEKTIRTDKEYDRLKKKKREKRKNIIEKIREKYDGPTCNEAKGKIKTKCEKICKEIYKRFKDRQDCEELEVDLIDELEEVYEILEDAKEIGSNSLNEIDSEVFETYISISISSLDRIIKNYSKNKARNFLYWLIKDEEIAEIFRDEDDEYNTLEEVLKKINSTYKRDTNEIHKIFEEKIEEGDNLIELIVDSSDKTIELFMDFINKKNPECKENTETRLCFVGVYCRIGNILDSDERDNWLSSESFTDYLKKIIQKKVNSQEASKDTDNGNTQDESKFNDKGWSADEIEDIGDIEDWFDDLCLGPFPVKNSDNNFIWNVLFL